MPSILDAPCFLRHLKLASRHLLCAFRSHRVSSQQFIFDMRYQIAVSLACILWAHLSSFPSTSRSAIQQLLRDFCRFMQSRDSEDADDTMQHVLRCLTLHLGHSDHAEMVTLSETCYLPCCHLLVKAHPLRSARALVCLGKAWVLLGYLRMRLAIPPVGVDPATKQQFKARHLSFTLASDMRPELAIRKDIQSIAGGFDETEKIEELSNTIHMIEAQVAILNEQTVARPEPSQYQELCHCLHQYLASQGAPFDIPCLTKTCFVGTLERIEELMRGLDDKACDDKDTITAQSLNWIETSKNFMRQTEKDHPLYMDILQPFFHGILEICHGLGAIASFTRVQSVRPECSFMEKCAEEMMAVIPNYDASDLGMQDTVEKIGRILFNRFTDLEVTFSVKTSGSPFTFLQVPDTDAVVFEMQLMCLHVALCVSTFHCRCLKDTPFQSTAEAKFSTLARNLMHVFEKLDAFRDSKAEEEAKLFKTSAQTLRMETDEEAEEASYRAMFPDHHQDFLDLEELEWDEMPIDAHSRATPSQAQSSQSESLMHGSFLTDIVLLHRSVFEESDTKQSKEHLDDDIRYKVAQIMLQILDRNVPKRFDEVTLSGTSSSFLCILCRMDSL